MQQRNAARELGLLVASIAVLVHWLDPAPALAVTLLIAAAAAAATGWTVGEWLPWRMPLIPMVLPALAAASIAGIARILSPWPWLAVDFAVGWGVVAWAFSLETAPDVIAPAETVPQQLSDAFGAAVSDTATAVRLRARRRAEFDLAQIVAEPVVPDERDLPPHPRPLAVSFGAVALAFLGFVAAGGLVPDGLAMERHSLSTQQMAVFVALSAAVAGVVGYRLAALASPQRSDRIVRVVAFGEYAVPVGIATFLLRAMGLPRLFIPALLTLVVYMITELRGGEDPLSTDIPLIQELGLLFLAGLAILVWGLLAG